LGSGWRSLARSHLRTALGGAIGLAAGIGFARAIGCDISSCPLIASAWAGALYGFVAGAVIAWPTRSVNAGKTRDRKK
jgi:hypothetical protein